MVDALVVIPTYNEIENIEQIIDSVMSLPVRFNILVVDDNSPDATGQRVIMLQEKFKERLFLLSRKQKNGLGTAYIAGFKWALERSYKYIFEMDADFSHNPKDLLKLHEFCAQNQADVVIGSRYVQGVNVINWPMSRVLLSWIASKYVRLITRMPIHDTTAGFVGYRAEVLRAVNLDKIKFIGYAFQIEMKYKAYLKKFRIKEVPVVFTDRARGQSKMSQSIIAEAVFGVLKMRLAALFFNHKL